MTSKEKRTKSNLVEWQNNNYDLIRLFAAGQVALKHALYHLGFFPEYIKKIIDIIPGVPVFFFISGFLIYRSYERNRTKGFHVSHFFVNRFLRLYPALTFCFIFSCILLISSGYIASFKPTYKDFFEWGFTSLTVFQFYNPPFLRDFGVGALNGSLWSISVEIQFYFLTPLLFFVLNYRLSWTLALLLLFVSINVFYSTFVDNKNLFFKLFSATFLPWFYYFMVGAIVSKYFRFWCYVLRIPLLFLVIIYVFVWQSSVYWKFEWDNSINPIGFFMLAILITKIAYLKPVENKPSLLRNDISYGIYIFHMPIINYFIFLENTGLVFVAVSLVLTVALAYLSWFLVEKPVLKMKKLSLR